MAASSTSAALKTAFIAGILLLVCAATVGAAAANETSAAIHPRLQDFLDRTAGEAPVPYICWADGTDPRLVKEAEAGRASADKYNLYYAWWPSTATDPTLEKGDAATITWSIVPDGTSAYGAPSNLVAHMDAHLAGWRDIFQQAFDELSAICGVNYVYEPNDDGASVDLAPRGVLGVRGDVRISGVSIDGPYDILALGHGPSNGDITLDTDDVIYFGPANDYRYLRNVIAHEAGHGLGLTHVISSTDDFLMEPSLNTAIDGPQLDDIRGMQRRFGDPDEFPSGDDTVADAVTLAPDLSGPGFARTGVGMDRDGDVDVYAFTVESDPVTSITVTPTGRIYSAGKVGGTESEVDSRAMLDLRFDLLATDGQTVLGTADQTGLGQAEVLQSGVLPAGTGPYYVRIANGGGTESQLYDLQIDTGAAAGLPGGALSADVTGFRTFPNPFSGTTSVRFDLARSTPVDLKVYDVSGRLIRVLRTTTLGAGPQQVPWDGNDSVGRPAGAGIYFYRLDAGTTHWTQKIIRVR